jgi:hypothetical protein
MRTSFTVIAPLPSLQKGRTQKQSRMQKNASKSTPLGPRSVQEGISDDLMQGYFRLGKALLSSGEADNAYMNFLRGLKHEPKNEELKKILKETKLDLKFGELDSRY